MITQDSSGLRKEILISLEIYVHIMEEVYKREGKVDIIRICVIIGRGKFFKCNSYSDLNLIFTNSIC